MIAAGKLAKVDRRLKSVKGPPKIERGPTHLPRVPGEDHLVIGALIFRYRVAAGMTMAELGAAVGVSHEQIRKIECGINRVDFVRMVKIADALGVGIAPFVAKVR